MNWNFLKPNIKVKQTTANKRFALEQIHSLVLIETKWMGPNQRMAFHKNKPSAWSDAEVNAQFDKMKKLFNENPLPNENAGKV